MTRVRAIREQYAGVWFRSRLEARWARLFNEYEMRWEYEPQGFALGRRKAYLPDFWLPDIGTVVEVKGLLDQPSEQKLLSFARACEKSGGNEWSPSTLFLIAGQPEWGMQIVHSNGITSYPPEQGVALAECASCHNWWFLPVAYGWECRSCGVHDGDHHIRQQLEFSQIADSA